MALPPAQATALAPLLARVRDARCTFPLLADRQACALADRLGIALPAAPTAHHRRRERAAIVRSVAIDAWVRDFLGASPDGTVVELGAGFNTRFERLDNGRQRWLDLDLPEVTDLRRRLLPSPRRREHLASSLTDGRWLDLVPARSACCFVLEAVLAYLPPDALATLLPRLARRFANALVIFDVPRAWNERYSSFDELAASSGLVVEDDLHYLGRCTCPRCAEISEGAPYRVARLRTRGVTAPR